MPSAPASSAELLELVKKSGLVPPDRFAAVAGLALPAEPRKAADVLIGRGLLTKFQAHQLLAGRHKGFRVGPYVILDLLGRGGMGAVYLAEHTELHRKVALKVLVPGRGDDQRLALERFLREARSAAALDHPNIVRIFDVARYNETPYLVMEFVDGETLQQLIDRTGPVPYATATEFVAQAAAGLQHAHERGFVHRDIKPGNLMRDRAGVVKILDMGLTRTIEGGDTLTAQLDIGTVLGTADFIAPEQAMNATRIDARADVYSLGATFFALLTGKPPFEGNTAQKLLQHQLKLAPSVASFDPTLPPGLGEVVDRMLAKKPDERFQTPAEVIAALTPWLGNSARIFAGLSRTNLAQTHMAQSADLHAALAEIALGGSSRRLGRSGSNPGSYAPDSAEIHQAPSGRDTAPVGVATTTRERQKPKPPTGLHRPRNLALLIAAVGVAALIAGAVVGWLVFGQK